LQYIAENLELELSVSITYFIPDDTKDGGEYRTMIATVAFVDAFERELTLSCGEHISFDKIVSLSVE
jgi:hypothetical protein